MSLVEIVTATRESPESFVTNTPLGVSLQRLQFDKRLSLALYPQNTAGLSEVYNHRILNTQAGVLVFMHDDVWIDDAFFTDRILEGLAANDVIGVAGSRVRRPRQPAWCFKDESLARDTPDNLSGRVAHGDSALGKIELYGRVPAPCELLDGLLLAACPALLRERQVYFDNRFKFHFYDMDFCRVARNRGLTLSTWPLNLTHRSRGAFNTPVWRRQYRDYLDKWGD